MTTIGDERVKLAIVSAIDALKTICATGSIVLAAYVGFIAAVKGARDSLLFLSSVGLMALSLIVATLAIFIAVSKLKNGSDPLDDTGFKVLSVLSCLLFFFAFAITIWSASVVAPG